MPQTVIQWDDDEPPTPRPPALLHFPDPHADDCEPLSPELEDELARILAASLVGAFKQDVQKSASPPGIPRPEQSAPNGGPIRRDGISKVDGE